MASLFSKITGRQGNKKVTSLLDLLIGGGKKKVEEVSDKVSDKVEELSKGMTLSEMLSVLQGRKIDPETGEESPGGTSPYMNIAMGQSKGSAPPSPGSMPSGQASLLQLPQLPQGQAPVRAESLPGPAGGIMGPPAPAQTQFTDVSQQGLMSPRTGQGPRPMQQGMQAGMQQMPGPQQRGLAGLMGMAPQQPQQEQEPNTQGAKMNEYLRGLLYG